jgi:hypothetical protein
VNDILELLFDGSGPDVAGARALEGGVMGAPSRVRACGAVSQGTGFSAGFFVLSFFEARRGAFDGASKQSKF